MEFEGEVAISTDKDHLWTLVSDPEVLVKCVPGAKEVEKISDRKYVGVVERGLAGVSVSLDGEVEMEELNPPESLKANVTGQDVRTNSRMDANAEMSMTEEGAEETTLQYYIDMEFTGRLATMGARIVKRKINSDINTFFDNIKAYSENEQEIDLKE